MTLGTFSTGIAPGRIAFDGGSVWITNVVGNSVTKLRASDGLNLGTFPTGANPLGIAFDGVNMWVANTTDGTVSKL